MSSSSRSTTRPALLIVQPYLTHYRLPIFKHLASAFRVTLFGSRSDKFGADLGDESLTVERVNEVSLFGVLFWQLGLIKKVTFSSTQLLFITANPRYLSTWLALLIARVRGIKVFLHGQGLYRKQNISLGNRVVYLLYGWLSDRYIAYTELSKESLRSLPIYKKAIVADNSVENAFPISKKNGTERGILFIGRLRDGSNIEMLIEACIALNYGCATNDEQVDLHVVGGGKPLDDLRAQYGRYEFVRFWGEIYDTKTISEISRCCFAGCYPGDAGLSVLHYMSLSLVPVVHSSLHKHMGPEPSYVVDGVNGVTFKREDLCSLQSALKGLLEDRERIDQIQRSAFERSEELTKPSLGERLENILTGVTQP